ncbi:dithiol-disulfide isomerase [Streptomyces antioxidans]|uniref:Dithiol-disulfide isomerase n=1 Tax=Streptomyces antioxidans TaxID=1507734 RepID=A0A1V4CVE0_9ACTN|nr:DsbA family protein [Streptomyces antioxidans]OPF71569.1 dithiol-disulfide isomerase [Streptomyces antioxidans]
MTSPHRVEVVLDFACVHCYIGFTRYARALRQYRDQGGAAETVFRPFQLRPDASPAGEPLVEVWARERGAAVAAELAADTSFGAADALALDFRRAVFTNTFDAHRLVARAAAQGTGERMAERLFRAYFADGLNIADPGTLARLAAETGVTDTGGGADELRAELARVRALGLPAPPVLRFADGTTLSGEIGTEDVLAALRG